MILFQIVDAAVFKLKTRMTICSVITTHFIKPASPINRGELVPTARSTCTFVIAPLMLYSTYRLWLSICSHTGESLREGLAYVSK